jgi:hypothetical protein
LPTLVLRGAESDLLFHATAKEMAKRGPKPSIVEFAGVGTRRRSCRRADRSGARDSCADGTIGLRGSGRREGER